MTPSSAPLSACRESTAAALAELAFRALFSSIFLGLGAEHVLADDLLRSLMPAWVPFPRLASAAMGCALLLGGGALLLGFRVRAAALCLGALTLIATLTVHVPGALQCPPQLSEDAEVLWTMFQRSNLVKNVCLLGVCIHLYGHRVGRFGLDGHRRSSEPQERTSGSAR